MSTLPATRRIGFSVFLVCACVALPLIAAEVVLRSRADGQLRSMLTLAKVLHFENDRGLVLTPGIEVTHRLASGEAEYPIRINDHGLRADREFAPSPGPRVARVLALGDSFTFGIGVEVEHTYTSRLEVMLQQRDAADRWEGINAGFASGNCPLPQYVFLRERGLSLSPKFVVVGFYVGNDLADMLAYTVQRGPDGRVEKLTLPGGDLPYFVKRTALYQYLGLRVVLPWMQRRQAAAGPEATARSIRPRRVVATTDLNPIVKVGTASAERPPAPSVPGWYRDRLVEAADLFSGMQQLLDPSGASLVLLFIPTPEMLYERPDPQADLARATLRSTSRAAGIRWVDPSDRLRAAGSDSYFPIDRHFTAKGHAVVAAALAESIRAARD